jgi:Flp pilus assembly protein TadD
MAQTWFREGLRQFGEGHRSAALGAFRAAVRRDPGHVAAWTNLGVILLEEGQGDEALAALERALALDPASVHARQALARALQGKGRDAEALAVLEEACALAPADPLPRLRLGRALVQAGRFEEALAPLGSALERMPGDPGPVLDLGVALWGLRRWGEAGNLYARALERHPGHAALTWNLAHLRLLTGAWREGWEAFEGRFRLPAFQAMIQALPLPHWDGRPLEGTLLVHTEQGFGDALMTARFLPQARQRAGRLVLVCQAELRGLLAQVPGVDEALPWGAPLPPHEARIFCMSLPGVLGVDEGTLPGTVPCLRVPRRRSPREDGVRRIGLVWKGQSAHTYNPERSLDPVLLAPLGDLEGIRWTSLQMGEGPRPPLAGLEDAAEGFRDFSDTAAALADLDLLVTVDTAVAHLGGALGIPVWLMIPWMPDWRWMLDREDSPWYPTVRLFRQPRPGDWGSVVQRIHDALRGT